jgi:HEAT repeat protein
MKSKSALEKALQNWRHDKCSLDELRMLASDAGKQCFEAAIPALVQLLDHEDEIVRYHAVMSLGFNLKYKPASNKLLTMLMKDTDEDVRDAAAGSLAQLWEGTKNRHIIESLAKVALEDSDEGVRKSAYKAMLIVSGVPHQERLHLAVQENISVDPVRINTVLTEISR